jgi:hypothetical protein
MPGSSRKQRAGGDLGAADICEEKDYPIGNNVRFPPIPGVGAPMTASICSISAGLFSILSGCVR